MERARSFVVVLAVASAGCTGAPADVAPDPARRARDRVDAPEGADEAGAPGTTTPEPLHAGRGGEDPASPPPRAPEPCAEGMALVAGSYCPGVNYRCLEWSEVRVRGAAERMHCRRFDRPECVSTTRVPMRFCMDRHEWPNREGELPRVLLSWTEARALCEGIGKRLCTEEEFNFACEGEELRPHATGFVRAPELCHYDRPYRPRTFPFTPHDTCVADPACARALAAIDQRLPIGATVGCVSPFGVHDLNGNVNEWVIRPREPSPRRSGIKGGWWGPVRNRCRPTVTFHDEGDYGYEVGFRCCSDAAPPG